MRFVPNVQEVEVVVELLTACKIATVTSTTIYNFGTVTVVTDNPDESVLHMLLEALSDMGYVVIGKLRYTEEFIMNSDTGLMTNTITLILQKEE